MEVDGAMLPFGPARAGRLWNRVTRSPRPLCGWKPFRHKNVIEASLAEARGDMVLCLLSYWGIKINVI